MHFAWLIAAAVSTGSPLAQPSSMVRLLTAQADDAPATDQPPKKRKKKKAPGNLLTDLDGDPSAADKGGLIADVGGDASAPKAEDEAGSKAHPLQLAEGAEKVLQVPGLASAESYDELAAEVSVKGDELHVKALSAGRTNVQATLKDGTFKTWVVEVIAAAAPATAAPAKPAANP